MTICGCDWCREALVTPHCDVRTECRGKNAHGGHAVRVRAASRRSSQEDGALVEGFEPFGKVAVANRCAQICSVDRDDETFSSATFPWLPFRQSHSTRRESRRKHAPPDCRACSSARRTR